MKAKHAGFPYYTVEVANGLEHPGKVFYDNLVTIKHFNESDFGGSTRKARAAAVKFAKTIEGCNYTRVFVVTHSYHVRVGHEKMEEVKR